MKPITKLFQIEKEDLLLWIPVLFSAGVAFFFSFEQKFLNHLPLIFSIFFCGIIFSFLERTSFRSLIFIGSISFLLGCFYANFYQKTFLNQTEISGKVYVDAIAKIESIKKFTNPVNHVEGSNLLLSSLKIYPAEFSKKKEEKKIEKKKIKKSSQKIKKKRKTQKEKAQELELSIEEYKEFKQEEKIKKAQEKLRKKQKKQAEKIQDKFANVSDYQEIDREFLSMSENYQNIEWIDNNGKKIMKNPPTKIAVNLNKNVPNLEVNDLIALRLALEPGQQKEFPHDLNYKIDARLKRVGAYGYVIGAPHILKKAEISNYEEWFLDLREKIRQKILNNISGDAGAVALAFLIGDQNQISKDLMNNIRNSGLAHLLSISGFHLSLAGMIFFVSSRFLLSRNEYLALHFNLKKLASIFAIIATYFYLKIAGSPVPAQRSFAMILLVFIALCFDEKVNSKRMIMLSLFGLIIYNPYLVFSVSFQLSFVAILTLIICHQDFYSEIKKHFEQNRLYKFFGYFLEIIIISIIIQFATMPFLMHSFQNVAILGFISNILAIPLTSFFVMPVGFFSFFLMPFGVEKPALFLMEKGILWLIKIINFVAEIDFSYFTSPQISGFGLAISAIGLFFICLIKSKIRFIGILVFLAPCLFLYQQKTPNLLFDNSQKFFVINDNNQMVFSENLGNSRERRFWLQRLNQKEFFNLETKKLDYVSCNEKNCLIENDQKVLVLLKRNKISEICKNNFDVIVNLTSKYKLPDCVEKDKIKIDNLDFYYHGGHFLYLENRKFLLKTTF